MHPSKYGQNILGRKYKALSSCSKDEDLQKRAPVLCFILIRLLMGMCHSDDNIPRKQFTPRRDGGHVKAKALGSHSPKGQEGGSEVIKRKLLA